MLHTAARTTVLCIADSRMETLRERVVIIHPDLGIGGAERLVLDAAIELSAAGYEVSSLFSGENLSCELPFLLPSAELPNLTRL